MCISDVLLIIASVLLGLFFIAVLIQDILIYKMNREHNRYFAEQMKKIEDLTRK